MKDHTKLFIDFDVIPNRTVLDRMNIPERKFSTRVHSADKYDIPIPKGLDLQHMKGNKETCQKDN